MQGVSIAAPAGRSKQMNPISLANLKSKKFCPGCGHRVGNKKSGPCARPITTVGEDGQETYLLDENQQPVICQHIFETSMQRRLKEAADDSIAERPLHLPEGTGHMALSHVEDSFDRLLTKVRVLQSYLHSI